MSRKPTHKDRRIFALEAELARYKTGVAVANRDAFVVDGKAWVQTEAWLNEACGYAFALGQAQAEIEKLRAFCVVSDALKQGAPRDLCERLMEAAGVPGAKTRGALSAIGCLLDLFERLHGRAYRADPSYVAALVEGAVANMERYERALLDPPPFHISAVDYEMWGRPVVAGLPYIATLLADQDRVDALRESSSRRIALHQQHAHPINGEPEPDSED